MKLSEQEWLDKNSARFGDDQQSMYFNQLQAILRGDLDMVINDHHEAAWNYEKAALARFFANAKKAEGF